MLTVDEKTRHLPYMQVIADADVAQLERKDREYGASWKSRGGVGAFMMLARKWDRLENMVKVHRSYEIQPPAGIASEAIPSPATIGLQVGAYDVFNHVMGSELERGDAESLLDTLGDLRRYLLLVESEICALRNDPLPTGAQVLEGAEAIHEALAVSDDLPSVERNEKPGELSRLLHGDMSALDPRRSRGVRDPGTISAKVPPIPHFNPDDYPV